MLPRPRLSTDGTGWLTITASPQWWREKTTASDWPDYITAAISVAEENIVPWLCGAIAPSTGRPCRVNTQVESCPHHGPGNEDHRCNEATKGGSPCRWNLSVRGECPNHPASWERRQKTAAEHQEAERLRQEKEQEYRRQEAEAHSKLAESIACVYCYAAGGEPCRDPQGEPAFRIHSVRAKHADHVQFAAASPCTSCGAEVGVLCSTSTGSNAQAPHSPRRRAQRVPAQQLMPQHAKEPEESRVTGHPPLP